MSKARWHIHDGKGSARGYALKDDALTVYTRELQNGNILYVGKGPPPKDSRLLRV